MIEDLSISEETDNCLEWPVPTQSSDCDEVLEKISEFLANFEKKPPMHGSSDSNLQLFSRRCMNRSDVDKETGCGTDEIVLETLDQGVDEGACSRNLSPPNYGLDEANRPELRELTNVIGRIKEAHSSASLVAGRICALTQARDQSLCWLQKSIQVLSSSVSKIQGLKAQLKEKSTKEQNFLEIEKRLENKARAIKEREKELDITMRSIEDEKDSLRKEEINLTRRERELSERESHVNQLKASIETREREIQNDHDNIKETMLKLSSRFEELGHRESAIQELEDKLQEKHQAWEKSFQEREDSLLNLQDQRNQTEEQLNSIKKSIQDSVEQLQEVRLEFDVAGSKSESLNKKIATQSSSLGSLNREIEAKEYYLEQVSQKIYSKESQLKEHLQVILQEKEQLQQLKRDIILQAQKALEAAEIARREQITLACIRRESIEHASQLYMKHLEAALQLDPPELLKNVLEKLSAMNIECLVSDDGIVGKKDAPTPAGQPNESSDEFQIPAIKSTK